MLKKFIPSLYIENYTKLDTKWLKENNIKLVLCDIDNTLVAHDEAVHNEDTKAFIERIRALDIDIVLISNNTQERVEAFSDGLEVKTYPFAKKPLKQTYKKVLCEHKVNEDQIACIGDQLLTDVFGGNRMGFKTVLCEPLYKKDLLSTKINRLIENIILKYLSKTGQFKKEILDEEM